MVLKKLVLIAVAAGTLAACETGVNGQAQLTADGQRALIGAAGASAVAAATDNDIGKAAVGGAAAGALCDDVTPGLCQR